MQLIVVQISLMLVGFGLCGVAKKDRVLETKLSDQDPGTLEYDHEAFLGKDEAKTVAKMTHEEKQEALKKICKKIDKDEDGEISEKELEDWIHHTQKKYIQDDVDRQFPSHDLTNDGVITWEEYHEVTYGHLDDQDWQAGEDQGFSYKDMLKRDEERWKKAAEGNGNVCKREHFERFLHPEEFDDMREVVLKETMDDMDKNKDGYVDMEEYISDMYKPETDGEEPPEWVASEKEQFLKYRDSNKDGKLDIEEIRNWILPDDYNHANAEAMHLIYESDDNKDGSLSVSEVLHHEDLFVGSQATDWGEALLKHEEL